MAPWLEVGIATITNAEAGLDDDGHLVQYEASYRAGGMLSMSGIVLPADNLFGADGYLSSARPNSDHFYWHERNQGCGQDPLFY